ncbi:MAG: YkvA family protein [Candidatus Sericytochromatia bacterium]|nr:YkvA family protein [Candidatus Sericytochromatia bacterium]
MPDVPDPQSSFSASAFDAGAFWQKLKRVAKHLPFAKDMVALYYCMQDRETPVWVKATIVGALAYFVLPADMVPDVLPMLGFTDDAAAIALALQTVRTHVKPEHYADADEALG